MYILGDGVARYGTLRVWAERGLVHWEDGKDNSYDSMPVRQALHRIRALNDMIGNSSTADKALYADQVTVLQRFIEDVLAVCRRARDQGMPHEPDARREALRRLPTTVVMPSRRATL